MCYPGWPWSDRVWSRLYTLTIASYPVSSTKRILWPNSPPSLGHCCLTSAFFCEEHRYSKAKPIPTASITLDFGCRNVPQHTIHFYSHSASLVWVWSASLSLTFPSNWRMSLTWSFSNSLLSPGRILSGHSLPGKIKIYQHMVPALGILSIQTSWALGQ